MAQQIQWHPSQQSCEQILQDRTISEQVRDSRWHERRAYDFQQSVPPVKEAHKVTARSILTCLGDLSARLKDLDVATARRELLAKTGESQINTWVRRSWGMTEQEIAHELTPLGAQPVAALYADKIDFENLSDADFLRFEKLRLQVERAREFCFNANRLRGNLEGQVRANLSRLEGLMKDSGRWVPSSVPVWANSSGHGLESKIAAALAEIAALLGETK